MGKKSSFVDSGFVRTCDELVIEKEADVKKTEAIKMTDELRTCKQELLEKLIEEQKKIILKMEEKKMKKW